MLVAQFLVHYYSAMFIAVSFLFFVCAQNWEHIFFAYFHRGILLKSHIALEQDFNFEFVLGKCNFCRYQSFSQMRTMRKADTYMSKRKKKQQRDTCGDFVVTYWSSQDLKINCSNRECIIV
uniref:Putative secreted protein n=1 Tax=Ixodes ricinus TaxID=34613 RepID=A0A6B0UNE9_IXORI